MLRQSLSNLLPILPMILQRSDKVTRSDVNIMTHHDVSSSLPPPSCCYVECTKQLNIPGQKLSREFGFNRLSSSRVKDLWIPAAYFN